MIKPYLTFDGQCEQAIKLYQEAFHAQIIDCMKFSELPNADAIPEPYPSRILQATLDIQGSIIRLCDCGPGGVLEDPPSDRLSLAVECTVDEVRHAFAILARDGEIGIELAETFYSPCAGVVYDAYGVMWNFIGR